jgi:membrane associated rhomboid family serine protease
MSGGPELFVVCKSCQSEVSPYVTECPYCGARLRKRAPKLPPSGEAARRPRRPRPRPSLGRLRAGEIPGIRGDARPWVTIAVVLVTCGVWLAWNGGFIDVSKLAVTGPLDGEWWRVFTSQFVYLSGLAQFFTLVATGIFGWLLEKRHGWPVALAVFLVAGAGGTALAVLAGNDSPIFHAGGVGAALGLLCAWAAPELLARRRGEETEGDLLGVAAIAFVLAAIPAARSEIDALAVIFGALIGALAGLVVARADS